MPSCLEWGQQRTQQCTQSADEGYNECTQQEDQGYRDCCDWWPCSWLCDAWVWVSNVVCVAWTWVSNVVCVAWTWITTSVCVVWDVITTVVNAVINTIESILGWVLSALAFIVQLIFSIPFVGRLLEWIWNVILTIVWGIVGLADAILGALGIRPEKKLRVCTLILDSDGGVRDEPSTIQSFVAALQNMITIYRREANVRIVDLGPFNYTSGFAGDETATADWVHIYKGNTPAGPLDTQCGASGAAEDLGTDGSAFELIASTQCFYGNFRRLIGYGAPVIIFGIRSIDPSTDNGCSLGPLSDYVTVLRTDPGSTPHEVGHACNLWHNDGATNLMNPNVDHVTTGIHLEWWQVIILRNSRHVTYF